MFYRPMSASGPTRLIGVDDRVALTIIKEANPQYAPFLSSIVAASNEFVGPMGFLAYGAKQQKVNQDVVNRYVQAAKPKFDSVIGVLGVTSEFTATVIDTGLRLEWTVSKGSGRISGGYYIEGRAPDFSGDYLDSLGNAAARWARYVSNLNPDVAQLILDAAKQGYARFMNEGTPSARQIMAVIKHNIRLDAMDTNMYIERLKGATERYQAGYKYGAEKYKAVFAWVGDALIGALYLAKDIFQVL